MNGNWGGRGERELLCVEDDDLKEIYGPQRHGLEADSGRFQEGDAAGDRNGSQLQSTVYPSCDGGHEHLFVAFIFELPDEDGDLVECWAQNVDTGRRSLCTSPSIPTRPTNHFAEERHVEQLLLLVERMGQRQKRKDRDTDGDSQSSHEK